MHLGLEALGDWFQAHREEPSLLLATVVATSGSTYRKAGAMLLASAGGSHAGLISGGCLEGDLLAQAQAVFADGRPRPLRYDLGDDPDGLLGLGLGCGGAIHLLLQRVDRDTGFGLLPALFAAHRDGRDALLALVTRDGPLPAGTMALHRQGEALLGAPELHPCLETAIRERNTARASTVDLPGGPAGVLLLRLPAAPLVLLCGAGPDAVPLAAQVRALGWRCLITDHRAVLARPERFAAGTQVRCLRPAALATALDLAAVDAAVVMTHHLGHDEECLRALLRRPPAYLGLLGPRARREQLEAALGAPPGLVRGPAGLDLGGEGPAAIALSVMAEIHAVLGGRAGNALGDG